MNTIKTITTILSLIAFALPAAAEDAPESKPDAELVKKLEAKAEGYWAPDKEAMLEAFTKLGAPEEDAADAVGESSHIVAHVETGAVNLYTKQGVMSLPYEVLAADEEKKSLTLRAAQNPDAPQPVQAVTVAIGEDRLEMTGEFPFILMRISKEEFDKRTNALPARPVGP